MTTCSTRRAGTVLGRGRHAGRAIAPGPRSGSSKSFLQAFAYRRLPGRARLIVAGGVRLGFAVGFERLVERRDENG